MAEFTLRVGQQDVTGLTNPSFESALASWTTDLGSWLTGTTGASPSATYLQGGDDDESQLSQTLTLPATWEVGGTAVLTFWQGCAVSSDPGQVKLEILDASDAVLDYEETDMTDVTVGTWYRNRLHVIAAWAARAACWSR